MRDQRIMVVEDERIVALHLRQQLLKLGYQVPAVVASGGRALRAIEDERPDLILMDIHIEGDMDGIATAAAIPPEYHIPVIYLTAYSEESTLVRARATKPYGYLIKPFSERELHATIQMALERCATEAALRQSEDRLRQSQKMQAIGNLTGGLAHDFNNILGIIIGNLDLVNPMLAEIPEAGELVQDAVEAALQGAELTKRLLAFARRQPLNPRPVILNELVTGVVRLLRNALGETIQISLNLAEDIGPVIADAAQITAALVNLANNARDAMPAGGLLILSTANRHLAAADTAAPSDLIPGQYGMIEVSDTGTGMTQDTLNQIFEPFFTTKEAGRGTGLGLSMVLGFMKQSGGHVTVQSVPGAGTTFRLYFPLIRADVAVRSLTGPAAGGPSAGETVLVVEDDESVRRIVTRQLADLGYRVLVARTANEALALLPTTTIDLLFTDIVMPDEMDGVALAQHVFAHWPNIKVLLTSGFPDAKIANNLGSLTRPAEILTKPYRKDDLASAVRRALRGT